MLLAILLDGHGRYYVRHTCGQANCPHEHLPSIQSAGLWATPQGVLLPPDRYDIFAPPAEGLLITSYSTPGRVFASHTGALSIKAIFSGREIYEVGGTRFVLEKGSYFVVNEGREYLSTIPAGAITETFCVSFGASYLPSEDVRRPAFPEHFLETVHRPSAEVESMLQELRAALWRPGCCLEEMAVLLLGQLWSEDRQRVEEVSRLDDLPRARRVEVYERLLRVREHITASLEENGCLQDWADLAGMSRYHFLRLFRQVFGITPHQHLIRDRLERAHSLLKDTRLSVADIASQMGFENFSHFSSAFRQHFGLSPRDLRKRGSATA